jgi:DNA polymerase-3 subunit epsilon
VTTGERRDLGELVHRPIGDLAFAVVDVETTGLYPDRGDRVCEVAVVPVGGAPDGAWHTLVDPRRSMSPGAVVVSGIDDGQLTSSPPMEQVAAGLFARLEGRVLVALNAPFVVGFLRAELSPLGWDLGGMAVVDARVMARCLPEAGPVPHLDAARHQKRRALPDALAVADWFRLLVASLAPRAPLSTLYPRPANTHLRSPDPFGDALLRIEEAISRKSEIDIDYFSPWSASLTARRVTPLSLHDDYYLEAYCRLRGAPRRFRIDRIRSVRLVARAASAVPAARATRT